MRTHDSTRAARPPQSFTPQLSHHRTGLNALSRFRPSRGRHRPLRWCRSPSGVVHPAPHPKPTSSASLAGLLGFSGVVSVVWLALWVIVPPVLGWTPFAVTSGSMAPSIYAGDIVITTPHDGTQLGPGTVIVFDHDDARGPVTHRIVDVTATGSYRTQGDANGRMDDREVTSRDVLGCRSTGRAVHRQAVRCGHATGSGSCSDRSRSSRSSPSGCPGGECLRSSIRGGAGRGQANAVDVVHVESLTVAAPFVVVALAMLAVAAWTSTSGAILFAVTANSGNSHDGRHARTADSAREPPSSSTTAVDLTGRPRSRPGPTGTTSPAASRPLRLRAGSNRRRAAQYDAQRRRTATRQRQLLRRRGVRRRLDECVSRTRRPHSPPAIPEGSRPARGEPGCRTPWSRATTEA